MEMNVRKMNLNKKTIKFWGGKLILSLILLMLSFISGCGKTLEAPPLLPENSVSSPKDEIPFSPNEEGYIEVVLPKNLLGGKDAQGVIEDFNKSNMLGENGLVFDIFANPDGTATYVFTPDQFTAYRSAMYSNARETLYDLDSFVSAEYPDEMMETITVSVDEKPYASSVLDRNWLHSALAAYAGTYQVLCGVPQDEWTCTITILDNATRKTIRETTFPNETMYQAVS